MENRKHGFPPGLPVSYRGIILRLASGTFVSERQGGKSEHIPFAAVTAHTHTGGIGHREQHSFVTAFRALFAIERIFGIVHGLRVDVRRFRAAVRAGKFRRDVAGQQTDGISLRRTFRLAHECNQRLRRTAEIVLVNNLIADFGVFPIQRIFSKVKI